MREIAKKCRVGFVYLALVIITFAVFWQVHNFEFTNSDDVPYVSKNEHIKSGFTWDNVIWVFTSEHVGNWHPLTGLSLMLDCQLFGPNPGALHLVNLLFHIVNTLLLFVVLQQMTGLPRHSEAKTGLPRHSEAKTGAFWQSAFVAALFALHPLHVESVAWIPNRKDVLSALFWFLTMAAYFRYVKNPNIGNYILALLLYALGLMSKPMLVTLPFVLLLLDYWPLNRLETRGTRQTWWRLIREKIPFFILTVISSIVTFVVQASAGAVQKTDLLPMTMRIANAAVSYVTYIAKMFWPLHLAPFYPHPKYILPWWQAFVATVLLVVITIFVIRFTARHRYLATGWFWYLGTLVPVIGLVQVGDQALADRYTYIPLTGLFIVITWGANDLLTGWNYRKVVLSILSSVVILVLSVCTWFQTGHWRNSQSIFEHALKVTSRNYLVHNNLGMVMLQQNQIDQAVNHFQKAIQYSHFTQAYYNLAMAYNKNGQYLNTVEVYKQLIKIKPNEADAYNDLGVAYRNLGRYDEAVENYRQALKIKPDMHEAYVNWSDTLIRLAQMKQDQARQKLLTEAKDKCLEAEAIKTGSAAYNLACVYALLGDKTECQKWLKVGEKAETLPTRKHAMSDTDLETVRNEEWFEQIRWVDTTDTQQTVK